MKKITYAQLGLVLVLLVLSACTPEIRESLPIGGNEEVFLEGSSDKSILLLHGLSATTWEVSLLAEFLNQKNFTVLAPVIAGHSTNISDLEDSIWDDWQESADTAYNKLINQSKDVYILGMSNGGLLALNIAAESKIKPKGIVSIAAPFKFKNQLGEYALIGKYIQRYSHHDISGGEVGHYYSVVPVRSVAETILLRQTVDKKLEDITSPILIIQSKKDPTTSPFSAYYLRKNIGSSDNDKEILWREEPKHVLINYYNEEVYNSIYEFIDEDHK